MHKISIFFLLLFLNTAAAQVNKPAQTAGSKPFVLGVIDEIQSGVLHEKRVLNIYLPEGYQANDSSTYPVIYLLDGSADEDFIHITGLVQFNSFEWINQIPKSIVVGIASVNRVRDFTFPTTIPDEKKRFPSSGSSGNFMSFIENELQPYIQKNYKTNAIKTIIGQSLGGLLATEILMKKPSLFNKYIIVSPSLWWNNGSLLNHPLSTFEHTDIYIGVGKEGLTPSPTPHVMEVDANVLADQIKSKKLNGVNVFFDYLPQENHATILHQAVFNAIRLFYSTAKKNQ